MSCYVMNSCVIIIPEASQEIDIKCNHYHELTVMFVTYIPLSDGDAAVFLLKFNCFFFSL